MQHWNSIPKRPLYLRSIFLLLDCNWIASRIISEETSPVGRTISNSSVIDISGSRTESKIGVGSCPWLFLAH